MNNPVMEDQRSSETRARAQLALVRLLHELGNEDHSLIVLGGLVPEMLTSNHDELIPDHLGTTDVDVLLITKIDPAPDLSGVERALERLDFQPDPNQDGWRWHSEVNGWLVKIEFLCDLPEYAAGESIRLGNCQRLAAANLRGTGYVAHDFTWEELSGHLPDGSEVSVRARFAGLEGYLLAKCVAVRSRAAAKDYYDFAYVLLHNSAGGPEEAAQRLLEGNLAHAVPALRSTWLEIRERYRRPIDSGPMGYAEQGALADPTAEEATLRVDAVDAVQRFVKALGI